MIKKGLIFGLLGFLISFASLLFFTGPGTTEEGKKLSETDYLRGWYGFTKTIETALEEPVSMNDELFVSILMDEISQDIENLPEINITNSDYSILWSTNSENIGKRYRGWKISSNKISFNRKQSTINVGMPIIAGNELVGYLYIEFKGNIKENETIVRGWKSYQQILAFSLKEEVQSDNSGAIDVFISDEQKDDLERGLVLGEDREILWSTDKNNTGKTYNGSWIEKASSKKDDYSGGSAYISQKVTMENEEVGDIHFLVNLPSRKKSASFIPEELLKMENLMYPIASFILLFIIGGFLSRSKTVVKEEEGLLESQLTVEEKEELEEEVEELEEEKNRLSSDKEKLVSEIAKKQKEKKDLENEIEALKTTREEVEERVEEKTEEEVLFNNLMDEGSGESEKSKEELELTQRIVAKRREEISLSARIEAKRKELIELERKIDEAKDILEDMEQ